MKHCTRTHADSRPRIHVWPAGQGVAWSVGASGMRTAAASHGAAVDAALELIRPRREAVIIVQGQG